MNLVTFDIPATGFSLANAEACVEASRLSYVKQSTIESDLNHILVLEYPEANIIAFRGTYDFRDFLTDGQCWRRSHIHGGFSAAFDSIAAELTEVVNSFVEDKPLFFTGHSLGGAQAVLAANLFYRQTTQIYTFGQPRVGDSTFTRMAKARLKGKYFRLVNQEDIVPRLPFYLSGFRHCGQEVFFPSLYAGFLLGSPIWFKLLSDIYGTWLDYTKYRLAQLEDHRINNYIARLSSVD